MEAIRSSPHDQAVGLREIGKQLGVANILTGSIQRAGGQLRIAARLVRGESESILWSNVFDRPASDIFAVQDEVARNVAQALQITLNTGATAAPVGGTKSTQAYDAYLLGRYHWNRRTTDGMAQATAAFKKAIDLDPNYAQAWSGLADAWANPSTREKATDDIIRTGEPLQALALARWRRGDKVAMDTLEAILRDHRRKGISAATSLFPILGSRPLAEPRVQAVARELGFSLARSEAR